MNTKEIISGFIQLQKLINTRGLELIAAKGFPWDFTVSGYDFTDNTVTVNMYDRDGDNGSVELTSEQIDMSDSDWQEHLEKVYKEVETVRANIKEKELEAEKLRKQNLYLQLKNEFESEETADPRNYNLTVENDY